MPAQFPWQEASLTDPQLRLIEPSKRVVGRGRYAGLEFLEVESKRIINTLPHGGMLPFRHTINAYRGCAHACTYCFARPTHEYLGFDIGRDFDTKIVVKVNAPELVRRETAPRAWGGELIAMGTNTDPYQPAEGRYRLTRRIIEVLGDRATPFSILTKSTLVLRDSDVLAAAAARTDVTVDFSVGTLDEDVWKMTEPGTPHPRQRIHVVRKLNDAGIPSGVLMGPVLPGLTDDPSQVEEVVAAAVQAGAISVGAVLLHLKPGVKQHYLEFLDRVYPGLVAMHRERYGARVYASAGDQRRLSALVRRLVAKHGGTRGRPQRPRKPGAIGVRAEQLDLGL